jgi:Nucleotidyl transferase AbiEii toxin, Type IV TA system
MTVKQYKSPEAYKQALEERIRVVGRARSMDMRRVREILLFDRFLTRIFLEFGDRAIVKGGVVVELRFDRARTTRDVDLRLVGSADNLLESLQHAAQLDIGDYLTFLVVKDPIHATIVGEGIVYEGQRFRAEARLAGRIYGMPFGVDAAFGDVLTEQPDTIAGSTFLDFVGAQQGIFRIYPRETHIAEKLHAYTMPRARENSRVKDLPDIALLAQTGSFEARRLRDAIEKTFEFRATHQVPLKIQAAPAGWAKVYARMALEDQLSWPMISDVEAAVRRFLEPPLSGFEGDWSPTSWSWQA